MDAEATVPVKLLDLEVLPTLEKVFGLDSGTSNPQPPQIMRPYPIRRW